MATSMEPRALKRKQSLFDDVDNAEPPSKSLKLDQGFDAFELGGALITNIQAIAVDASGQEFQPPLAAKNVPELSPYGLPTPDLTPPAKDSNPFDNVTVSAPPVANAMDGISNLGYVGDVQLFGLIPSKVYIYEHISDVLHPYNEVVKISTSSKVSLGSLLPTLQGSDWDVIALENPVLGFQEQMRLDGVMTRPSGLYFETDIVFQGALQPVSDFLRDFFKQENPSIRLTTWLSPERHYGKTFSPPSFALRGSLQHISVNVLDILTFREIGLELNGYQTYNISEKENQWNFGYGFFGKLDFGIPGTVVPLQVEYYLCKQFESWMLQMRLKDNEWTDIFGIKNLNLTDVFLQARLDDIDSKESKLSIDIGANLELRKTKFDVRGQYSKDFYAIEAYIGDLSLHDVGELFHELIGMELDVFTHDVLFRSMTLCISSDGFELKGEVTVNGHTSVSGGLRLSRDGIAVYGGIGDIEFENITIKQAALDVFIASKLDTKSAQASKVDIAGHVIIQGVELKAALHTEKSQRGEFLWTIYGEVAGDVTTSRIVPGLKDTFLDISLDRLALIASNHEAPLGSYKGINYPVAKGVQFCATIERIPELETLIRGSVKGSIFRATLADGHFGMGIILPADRTITFGYNVYTGPLMIEVGVDGADVHLMLKALLNVKVDTQPDPLKFSMGLKASLSGAAAYAQMMNDWVNPCNIGKQVTVSKCALEFGIVYATFFSTGMPGAIGLAGQIKIGEKEAKLAMKLSQNPKEQILAAAVKDLGVVDLVKFASQICEYEFPEPDDFLHFNDSELYLSTGASIGETYYPAGASLKGDMTIFGKRARFDCSIGTMVKIMATIEHFDLGPLTVKGATRYDPIVDIELSSSKQKVVIDGAVELWALSAGLHLEAEVYPQPKFDFWVDVSLSDWFKFKLEAKLKGDINFKDLTTLADADFEVYGLMEQHILDNIIDLLDKQINSMHENADFDEAKNRLTERENEFNASVQAAQDELDEARATWEETEQNLLAELVRAKSEASSYLQQLKDDADAADKSFVNAVAAATAILEEARHNEAVALHLAEVEIQRARLDSDEIVRQAQNELHRKRDAYQCLFGSARADCEQAKRGVDEAQAVVDGIDKELRDLECRITEAQILDMPLLVAEKATKTVEQAGAAVALAAVQAIYDAAERLIQGPEFVAAETAIEADESMLEVLIQSHIAAIENAEALFQETRTSHEILVQNAANNLENAQTHSQEQQMCTQTKSLLATGASVAESMILPAQEAYDSREECDEFLAVIAAEKDLASARSNSVEVELARQACDLLEEHSSSFADDILDVGLNIGKWIASAAAELINITKIEFSGSISGLVADGPPLIVNIEGTLLGQDIDIHINWQPHFNLAEFIKAIFSELWETIKNAAGKFLEAIGAKIVEFVEDFVEGVEEVAEAIGEGLEDAAEAIGEGLEDAAEAIGEGLEDAAEAIGEGLEDAADAVENVAEDVGHAVEGVVEDIDDALSDVGDAINGAASDVGHAFEDVANDIGNTFNDVGNDIGNAFEDVGNSVENVANDVGNFVGNLFSW